MFLKDYSLMFMSLLFTGTVIALSSNSWITCWLGLEINLMSLTPLIIKTPNFTSTESAIKYFIPQAMASLILIAAASLDSIMSSPEFMVAPNYLISISLAMKLGVAPFHFWFPQVMETLDWMLCLILMVWQKIAPFLLLLTFSYFNMILVFMILSSLVGALGGLNQNNLKLIMTFSSITHASWLLGSLTMSSQLWMLYYIIYSSISAPIVFYLNKMNVAKVNEIFSSKSSNVNKYLLIFNIMSLGGLPPFLGFSAKLLAIMIMVEKVPAIIIMVMIMASLLSLFYYAKMFFNSSLMKSVIKKPSLISPNIKINTLMVSSASLNLLTPALIFML